MIKVEGLLGVITFALWVFCLVDAIGAPSHQVRNLPKVAWILIILFFPLIGSIVWLAVGRPENGGRERRSAFEREQPEFPEYDRRGRMAAGDPEKDAEFLRQVRERAEAQRKAYEEQKKREREQGEG